MMPVFDYPYFLTTNPEDKNKTRGVYCAAKEIKELPESVNRLEDIRLFSLCEPGVLYISRGKITVSYGCVIYIDRQNLYCSDGVSGPNLNKIKIPECGHLLDPDFRPDSNEKLPFSKYSYSDLLTGLFS